MLAQGLEEPLLGRASALWFDARGCRLGLSQLSPRGDDMENLIDIFCHAIGITDPLSIKIAVGVIGGGIPMLFVSALFVMLGQLAAEQRESTMSISHRPVRRKKRDSRRAASVRE